VNFTYLLTIAGFGLGAVALVWPGFGRLSRRALFATVGLLLLLTAIFDNLIVAAGIVDYRWALTLGITTPIAPIEDYGYAIVAAICVPALWHLLARKNGKK